MTRNEPPGFDPTLYDADFFAWTQRQAAALRAMPHDPAVDVEHVAEEIEDLGKRDLREVTSLLELLFVHLLKIEANPAAPSVPHWRIEARAFRRSAAKAFSPGMRRAIDISAIWNEALDTLATDAGDLALRAPTPRPCPFTLDEVLAPSFAIDDALARLAVDPETPAERCP